MSNSYFIFKTKDLDTSWDGMLGKNPTKKPVKEIKAKTDKEARLSLIETIVKLYVNSGPYSCLLMQIS